MNSRILRCLLILGLAVVIIGCNKSQVAQSPDVTFKNFITAINQRDYEKLLAQMTPDAQNVYIMKMAIDANTITGGKAEKSVELEQLAKKHRIKELDLNISSEKELLAALAKAYADVPDKAACLADLMGWVERNISSPEQNPLTVYVDAELSNLKIVDDTAKGDVKSKKGELIQTIDFKKVNDGWLISMYFATPN